MLLYYLFFSDLSNGKKVGKKVKEKNFPFYQTKKKEAKLKLEFFIWIPILLSDLLLSEAPSSYFLIWVCKFKPQSEVGLSLSLSVLCFVWLFMGGLGGLKCWFGHFSGRDLT